MKPIASTALLAFACLPAAIAGAVNPGVQDAVPTMAPDPTVRIQERATTSYYSMVSTQIPRDERSIGMGLQREGTDEYYWLYCIDDAFTTRSGFAGCGTDDLYTSCSGRVAKGIDGDEIRCDQQCVTHKVYADLDVTTFTPFIGCGRGTSTMNLVRTSTGTGSPGPTRATEAVTSSPTRESSALRLENGFYSLLLAIQLLLFFVF